MFGLLRTAQSVRGAGLRGIKVTYLVLFKNYTTNIPDMISAAKPVAVNLALCTQ